MWKACWQRAAAVQDDQVVEELGCILDELKEKLPLLEDVANPAFQPRHWIEIHEMLGTLDTYCPVEVERRRRLEDAQATGDPADLSDLVREELSLAGWVLGRVR